ncbi:methyltransferase, putative, partial [Hepatocystis sp. ex Piliocolobus tephrosceles]
VYDNMKSFVHQFDCQRVIFITKHLCGNGTDLALRMLINSVKNNLVENYFILSPCCHHRCDVHQILGFDYLMELKIDKKYLQYVISHMSGYASCDSKSKKSLGKKIKLLIDLARVHYLLKHIQNAYLIKYVNRSITVESYAIIFFNHKKLDMQNFKYY